MDVCQSLAKCQAEKRHRGLPDTLQLLRRGPVVVGLHSVLRRGDVSDTEHLCCHSRIVLGNLWLQCGVTLMLT